VEINNNDLVAKVIEFVSNEIGIDEAKLKPELSLYHDLGVDGEDALELLEAFSKVFNVDVTGFPLPDYFGNEGSMSPIGFLKGLITSRTKDCKKRLTIEDLIESAERGRLKGSKKKE